LRIPTFCRLVPTRASSLAANGTAVAYLDVHDFGVVAREGTIALVPELA
jgi:hypothetical protein